MRSAGFVLVGGASSRMRRDKALLPWRNQTLAESVAKRVGEAAGSVALVGRTEFNGVPGFECIPDMRAGLGPLSGIETALASGRGHLNLIVACDMPLLETEWLKLLLETAKMHDSKCLVACDRTAQVHPLCGVYRADCLPAVQSALDRRQLKLMEILPELGAEHLQIASDMWNVNTPEEWNLCQESANGE